MAGCAALLEAPVVRILMAVVALAEGDTLVARFSVRTGRVTLFALHGDMLPGQRIARLGVIEGLANVFPLVEIVAGLALGAEASLVKILMTGCAGLGDADESPVEIFHLDQPPFIGGDVLRRMALLTLDPGVLSFQHVARLFMIEGLGFELRNREVDAIVVGVALGAFLAGAGRETVGEMQTLVSRQPRCDLGMTFQAFEGSFSARQLVACDTARRAFKIFMRTSERAG